MTRRVLVTVAHPDDETFGMGSVIAAAVEAGAEVTVCCATRGEAGEAHGLTDGADLGAVREAELRAAGTALGVSHFAVLGYGDSGMSGEPGPGTLAAAPIAEVVARLNTVLDDVGPDVVVTTDPDHGDGHRDHTAIGRATVEACRVRPQVRVYAWTVTRALLARWLSELQRARPDSAHLDLDRQGLGRPEEQITTVLDVAHLVPVRERAIALHASQVAPYEGMPADLRTEFLATDRLVRLQPPWTGGELEHSLW
jgi:LmbE family N-acetylglucosaminyl deacetylase